MDEDIKTGDIVVSRSNKQRAAFSVMPPLCYRVDKIFQEKERDFAFDKYNNLIVIEGPLQTYCEIVVVRSNNPFAPLGKIYPRCAIGNLRKVTYKGKPHPLTDIFKDGV